MPFYRLLLFGLFTYCAFAQTFVGNLAGLLTDSSGALLPNAILKLESPSTGLARSALSTAKGEFLFVDLPVGLYTLTVSAHEAGAWEIEEAASNVGRLASSGGPVVLTGAMRALTDAIARTENAHAA